MPAGVTNTVGTTRRWDECADADGCDKYGWNHAPGLKVTAAAVFCFE